MVSRINVSDLSLKWIKWQITITWQYFTSFVCRFLFGRVYKRGLHCLDLSLLQLLPFQEDWNNLKTSYIPTSIAISKSSRWISIAPNWTKLNHEFDPIPSNPTHKIRRLPKHPKSNKYLNPIRTLMNKYNLYMGTIPITMMRINDLNSKKDESIIDWILGKFHTHHP